LRHKNNYIPIGGRIRDRRHPFEENMYWCPQCNVYKKIYDFGKIGRAGDVAPECKSCHNKRSPSYYNRPETQKRIKEYYARDDIKQHLKEQARHEIINLYPGYVASHFKRDGIEKTPETIELKRQQIIMKRTLKELKKWRKENDPTITDVPGIESENETVDECA